MKNSIIIAIYLLLATSSAVLAETNKFRWQAHITTPAENTDEDIQLNLHFWPEIDDWATARSATFRLAHAFATNSTNLTRTQISGRGAVNVPLDLGVVLDLGASKQRKLVRNAFNALIEAFSSAPLGSRLRVFTFPHQWDSQAETKTDNHLPAHVRQIANLQVSQDQSLQLRGDFPDTTTDSLTHSADIGWTLNHVLSSWPDEKAKGRSNHVRAIIYIATSTTTVGNVDDVAAAALRAGNVPIFPIFLNTLSAKTSLTSTRTTNMASKRYEPGAYTALNFHSRIASRTGGWVLSSDLKALSKAWKSEHSAFRSQEAKSKAKNAKQKAKVKKLQSSHGELSGKIARLTGNEDPKKREKLEASLRSLTEKLEKEEGKPPEDLPEKQLGRFGTSVQELFAHLAKPLSIGLSLPCAHIASASGRPIRLSMEMESPNGRLHMAPIGGCNGGTTSTNAICIYLKNAIDMRQPNIQLVRLIQGNQVVEVQANETATIPRAFLGENGGELRIEVIGKRLCGDAQLDVRVREYDGMAPAPFTFWESQRKLNGNDDSHSEHRSFNLVHLGKSAHMLFPTITFRNGFLQTMPGASLALPRISITKDGSRASIHMTLLILLAALIAWFVALHLMKRRDLQRVKKVSKGLG